MREAILLDKKTRTIWGSWGDFTMSRAGIRNVWPAGCMQAVMIFYAIHHNFSGVIYVSPHIWMSEALLSCGPRPDLTLWCCVRYRKTSACLSRSVCNPMRKDDLFLRNSESCFIAYLASVQIFTYVGTTSLSLSEYVVEVRFLHIANWWVVYE